ncbi:MAG: SMC-Scp complex subunit ScpB [Theionarchaea archaeon]|nr:SMC-Scp complex subunit ScpB [Theionarchaea archaeon]
MEHLKQLIEAVLFVSGKPVSLKDLAQSFDTPAGKIKKLIIELQKTYDEQGSAVEIVETVDKKFVMQLKSELSDVIMKHAPASSESRAKLKTLSLIAYEQPILQSKVVKYRGTGAYQHIKELEAEGLIQRRPKERTYLLKTTPKFAEFYGLKSDSPESIRKFVEEHLEFRKLEKSEEPEKSEEEQ